jgi:transposase InsO family protein
MKKSKFTDQQIAFALQQAEAGTSVEEISRKLGISQTTFFRWKKECYLHKIDHLAQADTEIAETHVRYGYRRAHILLKREGWRVNLKRIHRLYRLEGLQMRLKLPRRWIMAKLGSDRSTATAANQIWAMDWMHGELFDGRRIWVLTIVDTWSGSVR